MMKVYLHGRGGRMGRAIEGLLAPRADVQLADEVDGSVDVIIDFTHFSAVKGIVDKAEECGVALVTGTTGLQDDAKTAILRAKKAIPIFESYNMSVGIALLNKLCKIAAPALGVDFDIEIVEKHHKGKQDAPSGTSLLLADGIRSVCSDVTEFIYGRSGRDAERREGEIGLHAVRGGNMPGQHTVYFLGPDETIELSHNVYSREIFARGAVRAAEFIIGKKPGLYTMDDLV